MPQPSLPRSELEKAASLYHEAVAAGWVPMDRPVGTGRKSAITYVTEKGGWNRNAARLRLVAARREGLIEVDEPARMSALRGDVGGPPIPDAAVPPEGFEIFQNSAAYDKHGNLRQQWVGSRQSPGEVFEPPPGHTIKGESALVDQDGRVIAKWIKTREGSGEGLIEGLRAAFAEYEGKAPNIPAPAHADADLLTVYPLPDLHLGMLAWGRETGASYDIKIATEMAINSIRALVEQSRPSEHAVLLGLGDYLHSDDHKAATPGSGHQLDVDGRFPKIFAAGAKLATEMVGIIAKKHRNVEVKFLSGNHDINSSMCLTVALSLFYGNTPRITVNDDPGIAWYRRFGACLLGGTHGHSVKPDRMALMMANDRAEDWGKSRHRHMMFGHIHTETAKEVSGIRIESFQAPAARDAWNAASGYRSGRSLSAITYHAQEGEIGRHRVNISGGAGVMAA